MTVFARAPFGRYSGTWVLATVWVFLAACSGSSSRPVVTPPLTSTGITLKSSTGTNQVQQGGAIVITATVTNDTGNAGVDWALDPAVGAGTLSTATATTVTYTAPTGFVGTITPTLTATSKADTTKNAGAVLVVSGTPEIDAATVLFPGYVSSAYGAAIRVSGGLAPFTWTQTGTLPAGITFNTAQTGSSTSLTGTPTATGTYPFQVKVTDKNGVFSSAGLTLEVKAAAVCLLEGSYAVLYSGYVNTQAAVGAASLTVSSAGTITGYQDFNAPGTPVAETLTGTCTTRTANNGTLTLTGAAHKPEYNFAITTGLRNGRVQLQNGADSQSGSGLLLKQDPGPYTLAALQGNFAFGALGAQANGKSMGIAGAVAIDASGVVTEGHADANGSSALTDAPLSGSLTLPDTANSRGTLSLTSGSQTFQFAYYVINPNRLLIVSSDSNSRLAGFMTRQNGSFDNSSLASPGILSSWGVATVAAPKSVLTLARLANANATAGTIDLTLDTEDQADVAFNKPVLGAAYMVRSTDGRTTLNYTSGGTARQYALYLDGGANGYLVEHGGVAGSAGFLEAQAALTFNPTIPGLFVSGTQYAGDVAPISMFPSVRFSSGNLSTTDSNTMGTYALNPSTGRGFGTLSITGSGTSVLAFYVVGPNKVIALITGAQNRSATIDWMSSD